MVLGTGGLSRRHYPLLATHPKTMNFQGNYIDLIILVILTFFIAEGIRVGLWPMLADFFSLLFALLVGLVVYPYVSDLIKSSFSITHSFSNVLGFLFASVIAGAFFNYLISLVVHKIPMSLWKNRWNHFVAIIPAFFEALVLISFATTLVIGIPISPKIKSDISDSRIGEVVLRNTSVFSSKVNDVFGGAIEDSLSYLTVHPQSDEIIPIATKVQTLTTDSESETEMFNVTNEERRKHGIGSLSWDDDLSKVGREYGIDMWQRKFFGHYSPEGENVGDRLRNMDIDFTYAGENLALAPGVTIAHVGLMNSEGHRENILDKNYKKLGIGCVDNGVYGKIFVQVFSD
jgi:uncharacterized protein YkwD